jgi:hypothetical protein
MYGPHVWFVTLRVRPGGVWGCTVPGVRVSIGLVIPVSGVTLDLLRFLDLQYTTLYKLYILRSILDFSGMPRMMIT